MALTMQRMSAAGLDMSSLQVPTVAASAYTLHSV